MPPLQINDFAGLISLWVVITVGIIISSEVAWRFFKRKAPAAVTGALDKRVASVVKRLGPKDSTTTHSQEDIMRTLVASVAVLTEGQQQLAAGQRELVTKLGLGDADMHATLDKPASPPRSRLVSRRASAPTRRASFRPLESLTSFFSATAADSQPSDTIEAQKAWLAQMEAHSASPLSEG